MHKIKNIFPMIYDFENLFNAYKAGIKCKRYRPDVMAYTDKLEEGVGCGTGQRELGMAGQ